MALAAYVAENNIAQLITIQLETAKRMALVLSLVEEINSQYLKTATLLFIIPNT